MRAKWVDTTDYVGPDRRRDSARRLFKERRKFDETGQTPSLPSMIRRLRVKLLDLRTPEDRTLTLQLARAAIAHAEAQHKPACADLLANIARMIQTADSRDRTFVDKIDIFLTRALTEAD